MFNSKQSVCQVRPILSDVNSDETLFYPFTIIVNSL